MYGFRVGASWVNRSAHAVRLLVVLALAVSLGAEATKGGRRVRFDFGG